MANFEATFNDKDTLQAKAAAALGAGPGVCEIVRREDYKTDAEYIKALVDTQEAMNSPAYRDTMRKAQAAESERQERETREAQRKEYAAIRSSVTLSDADRRRIDEEAAQLARRDLAAGRIFVSDLARKIEEYAAGLEAKAKDERAAAMQFNSFLRASTKA